MADKAVALKAPKLEIQTGERERTGRRGQRPSPHRSKCSNPDTSRDGKPELGDPKDKIKFQFNPKEVSITKSAKWERKPTKDKKAGPPEYSGAEPCKMTLELFFDATMKDDVDVVDVGGQAVQLLRAV